MPHLSLKDSQQISTTQQSILFIDDEPICHDAVKLILNYTKNYRVISGYNGEEAISLAKKYTNEIDLILLDILLPDMSGYEIYKQLKADQNLAHIPIIFQSGVSNSNKEAQNILEDEGIFVINKPYSNDELMDTIARYTLKK